MMHLVAADGRPLENFALIQPVGHAAAFANRVASDPRIPTQPANTSQSYLSLNNFLAASTQVGG